MKKIIIISNDSFGLDIKRIIFAINANCVKLGVAEPYSLQGFIVESNTEECVRRELSPCLGEIDQWIPKEGEVFAIGIVEPHIKKEVVEKMKAKGAVFETLRAPWVLAHKDFQFPEGSIIAAQSVMDSARIGKYVILFHAMIGFDALVEEYSSIMAYANITTAHIGKRVLFYDNAVVISKTINDDAIVYPNSVVIKEVKEGTVVAGNPAKRIKERI